MPLLATAPGPFSKTSRLHWTTFVSGAPPTDPNDNKNPVPDHAGEEEDQRKKIALDVLELLCRHLRVWYQDLDSRTDELLAGDLFTARDSPQLQLFYDLNDLSLDIDRIQCNLLHARNISILTSDTGGTA